MIAILWSSPENSPVPLEISALATRVLETQEIRMLLEGSPQSFPRMAILGDGSWGTGLGQLVGIDETVKALASEH